MDDAEIGKLLDSVITSLQVFAGDRCCTAQEYAEVDADIAGLERLADEVRRLNAILGLMRASEERLMAALAESERTSEALSKYLNYLSVENSRLRARIEGTVNE